MTMVDIAIQEPNNYSVKSARVLLSVEISPRQNTFVGLMGD